MNGFYGKYLYINLSGQTFEVRTIEDQVFEKYLGCKGLAAHLLTELNPAGVDPLSPDNHLIFATGPLSGSTIWGGCRYGVFSKSPQTGLFAESYAGGKTPEAIDACGFDAIVIHGACAQPGLLTVHPGGVEFHQAGEVWGMETYQAEDALNERLGLEGFRKKGAVVIGPAAENLVRFSVVENDYWRSAGRTGMGAVMGSKKLKGILFTGDCKREHHDKKAVAAFSKDILARFNDSPPANAYRTNGTPMLVKLNNLAGSFPTRYWQDGTYDKWESISADALHKQADVKPRACAKCFMACGRLSTVRQGRHAGLKLEGPEYETIYAFGGLCMIDSIEEIIYLNDICDRLGMDTITSGNLCGFAIEASRAGKIDYAVDYGQVDAIAGLLGMIARREGVGDVLARGIRHAARQWGMEDEAVHVKGMEPAGYDPRVLKGMGLAYATSDRGACHLRATFYKPELSGMIPPEQIEGKAELFLEFESRLTFMDMMVVCRFYRDFYLWDELVEITNRVTGLGACQAAYMQKALDVHNLVRRFNLREGMTRADETLPPALHRPLQDSGKVLEQAEFQTLLKDYYRLHGWDENGMLPD